MKIGYPCINRSLPCRASRTFRLKSYAENRLIETVESNLDCLLDILRFNVTHNLLFFRITSDLVPFASHPVCTFPWQDFFGEKFERIGNFIKTHRMRISMHPDQFTLLNSQNLGIFDRSVRELSYHAQVLDLMRLDTAAKIQIHVGGIYGDKKESMKRFIQRFQTVGEEITRRLVIENDDRQYAFKDCIAIHGETGIPVLFDLFHHTVNNSGEPVEEILDLVSRTWRREDGLPMMDYSSQKNGGRRGQHTESIDRENFMRFLERTKPFDFDVMLEIKDKERSALKAAELASRDQRFTNVFESWDDRSESARKQSDRKTCARGNS